MHSAELIVILLNISIVLFVYLWLYPRVAGADINKVSLYDLLASMTALSISALLFWDSGILFNAYFDTLNWFWFTLLTYFVLEVPFIVWYFKKYNLFDSMNNQQ